MIISWFNKEGRYRQALIKNIEDIECFKENSEYGIRIRENIVLIGGCLGTFRTEYACVAAYNDIKHSLKKGDEDFIFRKNFYER